MRFAGAALADRDVTETLLRLAGVLLGKASLDWLYGLIGELPQTVPQFLAIPIRPGASLRRCRMNKIVVFLSFHASCRRPSGLAFRGRAPAPADHVGRAPGPIDTAPRTPGRARP